MNRTTLFFVLMASLVYAAEGQVEHQNDVKIILETPVQYGVGYTHSFNQIYAGGQVGFLSEPNSTLILGSMQALGVDEIVVDLIENAFQFGWVFELNGGYQFEKFYAGLFFQYITLSGDETPNDIVELVLDVDLNAFPRLNQRVADDTMTLDSDLTQLGLQFGHNFDFSDSFFLNTEVALSMNIGSSSSVSSPDRDYSGLSPLMDDYLKDIYRSYAFVPSITVGFGKRF